MSCVPSSAKEKRPHIRYTMNILPSANGSSIGLCKDKLCLCDSNSLINCMFCIKTNSLSDTHTQHTHNHHAIHCMRIVTVTCGQIISVTLSGDRKAANIFVHKCTEKNFEFFCIYLFLRGRARTAATAFVTTFILQTHFRAKRWGKMPCAVHTFTGEHNL